MRTKEEEKRPQTRIIVHTRIILKKNGKNEKCSSQINIKSSNNMDIINSGKMVPLFFVDKRDIAQVKKACVMSLFLVSVKIRDGTGKRFHNIKRELQGFRHKFFMCGCSKRIMPSRLTVSEEEYIIKPYRK